MDSGMSFLLQVRDHKLMLGSHAIGIFDRAGTREGRQPRTEVFTRCKGRSTSLKCYNECELVPTSGPVQSHVKSYCVAFSNVRQLHEMQVYGWAVESSSGAPVEVICLALLYLLRVEFGS